jgi:integrase
MVMAKVRKRTWTNSKGEQTAWIADYFDQAGKRHIKTFTRQGDAKAWLVTAQGEVARGVHTPENASITVAEAAELWVEKGKLEQLERSTLRQYRNHIALHIVPLIGGVKLARLSTPTIEGFRDDLLRKGSRPMARKVLASLKSILGESQRRGLVAHNAAHPVKVAAKKREKRQLKAGRDFPSKHEANRIISVAEGRWRPLLITAVFTGMRSSEIRGLTWEAVDLKRKAIHVYQRADAWNEIGEPKSEAGDREIPMSPMVANALKEWRLACPKVKGKAPDGTETGRLWLVFPNGNGNIENHANIANRGFYALQLRAGITEPAIDDKGEPIMEPATDEKGRPRIGEDGEPILRHVMRPKYGFHALRHFFASWAIEQGFSAKRLQALLGHASIQMTFDIYGGLFPDDEDDLKRFADGEAALIATKTV